MGEFMNDQYQLLDGSPRYGIRNEGTELPQDAPKQAGRGEEIARTAAGFGLDHLAAAIDRRLTRSWADTEDPLVETLRADHPEELTAAKALVKLHLGTQMQWRKKAEVVRNKALEDTVGRRKATGLAQQVLFLRIGLLLGLASLPIYVAVTDNENLLKLLLVGIACLAVAFMGGHALTIRERLPVMPNIKGSWLKEVREDIVNATLVEILQNKGVDVDSKTVTAGRRGWESIVHAAKAVDILQN